MKNQQKNKGFTSTPNFKKKGNLMSGFTLIELMVATSIFVIIMLTSMSSLFILLGASKNSRALRFAMDNVNFSMESMARSIRMGTNYICAESGDTITMTDNPDQSVDCRPVISDGGTLIAFIPQTPVDPGTRVGYKLGPERADGTNSLQRCEGDDDCIDIVSSDVDMERLKFFVKGSSPSDGEQASIYIIMKGTVMVKGIPTSFAIQTMASQRNF